MLKARKPSTRPGAIADQAVAMDSEVANGFSLDAPVDDGQDYAGLGEHVVSVVKAADEAAARIRQAAEDDAAHIAAASHQEATTILEEANRDADKLLFEVEQRRAEADRAADATRKAAEEYAEQQRREAQEHASRLLAQTDQEAAMRAEATAERYKTLQENLVRTEERLEQLVGGLRELARGLEDVLTSPTSVEQESLAAAAITGQEE